MKPVFHLPQTELREGTTVIEASAGTGKTYTIAGLFLRLILEKGFSVRQILVVTYTVAATEELRDRVRQTLAAAWKAFDARASDDPFLGVLLKQHAGREADLATRLRLALDTFDEAAIYTIHAFCQRVLQDRAFETGSFFDAELVTDQLPLLRQVVDDYWRGHFYRAGRLSVSFALRKGLSPQSLLPLVRDSLSRPFLRMIAPVQGKSAESLAAEVERIFSSLCSLWRGERANLRTAFGSSAKWANQPYNSDERMAEVFRQLDTCLGAPDFPPAALDALELLCGSAIAGAQSKRSKVPAPKHRFFDLCDELAKAVEHYVMGVKVDALQYVQRELPRRKDELKVLFYDDLLSRVHGALIGSGGGALAASLREQYRAALIDEFQDTDPLQYQIFRRVFAGAETASGAPTSGRLKPAASTSGARGLRGAESRLEVGPPNPHDSRDQASLLFLIGDPKQAIYGFRGADIFTYLKASEEAAQAYTLRENWRSETSLVRSVNAVFGVSALPFVFPRIRFQPVEAKGEADKKPLTLEGQREPSFRIWFSKRTGKEINKGAAEKQITAAVATEIVRLLNDGAALGNRKLLPEDIAVLVPVNRQAQMVQAALAERKVPSVLYTDADLFESREALETQRVLAAVVDPTNEAQLLAALATDLVGYGGARIEALATREQERQQTLQRFHDYLHPWIEKGFIQMFRNFMECEQVRSRLLAFPYGERRLTNLLHLSEVLHRVSVEQRLGISEVLKWLGEQREAEGQAIEEHQLRLETDEKAVKLVTIHKSKGLEYPVVFCPFSWRAASIEHGGEEQVFFHDPADYTLSRDLGGAEYEAHKQLARVECLAENVRQFYVALTRARHRCYFAWGAFRDAATSAPAWLLHPPQQCRAGVSPAQEQSAPLGGSRDDCPTLPSDPIAALEEHFPQLDDSGLLSDLAKLAESSQETGGLPGISVGNAPEPDTAAFAHSRAAVPKLDHRKFSGVIHRDWRISSFTSLTASHGGEQPDYDEFGAAASPETPASGIFAFPGGANPGTCLHKILERLDFTQWSQSATADLVREQLRTHGLPDTEFTDVVVTMLGKVMTAPLDENVPGLALEQISVAQRMQELEFYFPLQKITSERIHRLLREHGVRPSSGAARSTRSKVSGSTNAPGKSEDAAPEDGRTPSQSPTEDVPTHSTGSQGREPEGLSFSPVQGMLKGFIDLVFEFNGRFYIVDWKSNLLGNRTEDYSAAALAEEVRRRHYYFQYQLYTFALDRYLSLRLRGYRYEQHFGGVYYMFLRGIDPSRPQFGIHRDRLSAPLVRELGGLLIGKGTEKEAANA